MARTAADRGVPYFPAFLDLLGKRVVVVGGGRVAAGKVRALLPCQPVPLVVVAPEASATIRRAAAAGRLEWHARAYAPTDLAGAALAFGATDDGALNARIAADARARGIPVLAVDDVAHCDFIAPALVRRGDVVVAISTGGRSPAMARRTRERLDAALPRYWGELLDVAADVRDRLGNTRALIAADDWQHALDGEVEQLVEQGALDAATERLLGTLERSLFAGPGAARRGLVSLVGGGPGDPGLLTLRALQRLQAADVIVFDRLVGPDVLALGRAGAEQVDVGKTPGGRGPTQAEINRLLIARATAGQRVVRLKGGDPYVFGRGGEEALALLEAGLPYELVPGISSALAAPALAGIPVTHRGLSAAVTILNGHADAHDWASLATLGGTLVCLMAVEQLAAVADRLLAHGRPVDEPTALVEWASTPRQRVVAAPLGELVEAARAAGVQAPAVLVVGPTAALAARLGQVASPETLPTGAYS
jgi:uroporphyrin-III C-methyltransferase/precorrin-2 dehydrogenase/sirohydrochlorin ferrochelatase